MIHYVVNKQGRKFCFYSAAEEMEDYGGRGWFVGSYFCYQGIIVSMLTLLFLVVQILHLPKLFTLGLIEFMIFFCQISHQEIQLILCSSIPADIVQLQTSPYIMEDWREGPIRSTVNCVIYYKVGGSHDCHVTNPKSHVTNLGGHVPNLRGHVTNPRGHVTNPRGHVTNHVTGIPGSRQEAARDEL